MPQKPFHAIDITLPADKAIESTGVAYYRMDDHMYDFIMKCMEGNKVIGFAWEGTRNLGFILKSKPADRPSKPAASSKKG